MIGFLEKVRKYRVEWEAEPEKFAELSEQRKETYHLKADNEKLNPALKSCEALILKQTFEIRSLEENRVQSVSPFKN
jgi:hypothetical protein